MRGISKGLVVIAGVGLLSIAAIPPMTSKATKASLEEKAKLQKLVESSELESANDQLRQKENTNKDIIDAEKKYKELCEEMQKVELRNGTYDYKADIESRLSATEAAVNDMKREVKRGLSKEYEDDFNYRIKKLSPIIEKYDKIMKQTEADLDYQEIAAQLNADLDKVQEEINQ